VTSELNQQPVSIVMDGKEYLETGETPQPEIFDLLGKITTCAVPTVELMCPKCKQKGRILLLQCKHAESFASGKPYTQPCQKCGAILRITQSKIVTSMQTPRNRHEKRTMLAMVK